MTLTVLFYTEARLRQLGDLEEFLKRLYSLSG